MDRKNFYFGVICIIAGASFIGFSRQLDSVPALFPTVVAALLLGLGIISISPQIILLVARKEARAEFAQSYRSGSLFNVLRLLPPLVIAIIYTVLFKIVGFLILTPILIISTAWYLGYRKIVVLLIASLGFTLILYLLFGYFLNVPIPLLPRGV